MPLWPFRRKSRRKRGRADATDYGGLPPRSQTVQDVAMAEAPAPERQTSKRKRTEPNKLHRRPRAYSFSPGRQDSVQLGRKKSTRAQHDANTLPAKAPDFGHRLEDRGNGSNAYGGVGALEDEKLWRVPTLRNKRDGDHLPKTTSSKKRRKDDQQREAEIKAMCSFAPLRPATEDWMLGRPMKKESRKAKAGFSAGFRSAEFERYNRSSDISLPLPESIDSTLSSDSDYISYKVSALEALAPRPTLRYTTHPRPGAVVSGDAGLVRRASQQRTKLTAPIPEATLKAHRRVDSLADDLNASDLRELMERDQRRRARKKQLEQERLERRIARRAEKQKAAEAEAAKQGRESPPNLERGIFGREDLGLGIDPASAVVTSSRIRDFDYSPEQPGEPMETGSFEASRGGDQSDPLAAFHRVDSVPLHPTDAPSGNEGRTAPTLTSAGSKGSFRRKLSRSKSPQQSESRTERSEQTPNDAEGGTARGRRSWSSFFRWTNRSKRHSGAPPSFSNTSRDSMQTTQSPTPPTNLLPRRMSSGVPKRTMSRFREDLPELPISPPTSRMQSPDSEPIHTLVEVSFEPHPAGEAALPSPSASHIRHDTPISERRSAERMRHSPSTGSPTDEPGVSPEPQAISLASIDSEGSWFSGRLSKKRKPSGILEQAPGLRILQHTPESDSERRPENENTNDDIDIADDDYLSRLAPAQGDRSAWNRKSTGEARPSSDWGDGEAHWGSVKGQQPTVVPSHAVGRVKSREGLLNSFGSEGDDTLEQVNPDDSSDSSGDIGLQRATSIDYGKARARRVSAGSARLLSITPRSSVDAKHENPHRSAQDS